MKLSQVKTIDDIMLYVKENFDCSPQRRGWIKHWLIQLKNDNCMSRDNTMYKVAFSCPFNSTELQKVEKIIKYKE